MSFQPLLKLVPPLKTICLATGSVKTACRIAVTKNLSRSLGQAALPYVQLIHRRFFAVNLINPKTYSYRLIINSLTFEVISLRSAT